MTAGPAAPGTGPTWADVLDLVSRLDESGLADAEIIVPGLHLRVSRHALSGSAPAGAVAQPGVATAPTPTAGSPPEPEAETETEGVTVTAPMLGTLYLRPTPDAPPFVNAGDTVAADDTVAIIEVMKLMNPVPAGVAGTVLQICAAEGSMVEYGQAVLQIEPAARS